MIVLNKWYGRLGNNIIQLSNIIAIAIAYKHNIVFNVNHKVFDLSVIQKYFNKYNNSEYKKIIIVCEDRKNPVVHKLLELYENSVYNKNSLEEDIKIILGATNIVYSVGTFIPSLMLLSENIKYIHGYCGDNVENQDYYKIMKPWKNTQTQREYILKYGYD